MLKICVNKGNYFAFKLTPYIYLFLYNKMPSTKLQNDNSPSELAVVRNFSLVNSCLLSSVIMGQSEDSFPSTEISTEASLIRKHEALAAWETKATELF